MMRVTVDGVDELARALRRVDRELQKETRRRMAAIARRERDRIRADWPRGPSKHGHSFRAVTSGTSGLVPTLKLRRGYRPYVPWLIWGGKRPRDRQARPRGGPDGRWFYPGVTRARRQARDEMEQALRSAKRRAGL